METRKFRGVEREIDLNITGRGRETFVQYQYSSSSTLNDFNNSTYLKQVMTQIESVSTQRSINIQPHIMYDDYYLEKMFLNFRNQWHQCQILSKHCTGVKNETAISIHSYARVIHI